MKKAAQSLGQLLRFKRLQAGIGLRQVARWVGITPSYMSDIEHDRRVPANRTLCALSAHLGLLYEQTFSLSGKCPTCKGSGRAPSGTAREPAK